MKITQSNGKFCVGGKTSQFTEEISLAVLIVVLGKDKKKN
jgi:hypothetical protein